VVTWPSLNHRLPELWTNPEKFDPERFAEPRSEHKKHRYAFAPFGGGAHKCIGTPREAPTASGRQRVPSPTRTDRHRSRR